MGLNLSSPKEEETRPQLKLKDLDSELWTTLTETMVLAAHPRLGSESPLAGFFRHPCFEPRLIKLISDFSPNWKAPLKRAITAISNNDDPNALASAIAVDLRGSDPETLSCFIDILRKLLVYDFAGKGEDAFVLEDKIRERLRKQTASFLWGSGIGETFSGTFMNETRELYTSKKQLTQRRMKHALEEFFEEIAFAQPNEIGAIRRLFHSFGVVYQRSFPDAGLNTEQIYQLAYTSVLINAEIHSLEPAGKIKARSKEMFIETLRNVDLPQEIIAELYDDIKSSPLRCLLAPKVGTNL
eukprot:TRINITY_DN4426_c0_g1_i1.p1 TRINITY_DN4426_c0_g1~~TRINITY_DN4426_c0_g1_i1.p1  ORF type:complete len:298 (+),score=80.25 TRINITY_DN4426_c0_g1_i1:501-1394(+)